MPPAPLHTRGPDWFRTTGQALFGEGHGWQSRVSELTGFDRASVSRWASGRVRVPHPVVMILSYALAYGLPLYAEADEEAKTEGFRNAGQALFDNAAGWQSRVAELIGCDRASVSRWASGGVRAPRYAALILHYAQNHGLPETALSEIRDG